MIFVFGRFVIIVDFQVVQHWGKLHYVVRRPIWFVDLLSFTHWMWTSGEAVQLIQRNHLFGCRQGLSLLLSAEYHYNDRRIYDYKFFC